MGIGLAVSSDEEYSDAEDTELPLDIRNKYTEDDLELMRKQVSWFHV